MWKMFSVGNIEIPTYGTMVLLGIIICNCIAQAIMKKKNLEDVSFWLIEVSGAVGALIGAKILTVISLMLNGSVLFSLKHFKDAGYSYYGGLVGFIVASYLICRLRDINNHVYAERLVFLLPLLHIFWKCGCFFAGCCFGIPYDGVLSVCYPAGINLLSGIRVFPVQLLEALIALIICIVMLLLGHIKKLHYPIATYLISYGTTRFIIEFFRYHNIQNELVVAQLYSVICVIAGFILIIYKRKNALCREKQE